MSGQTAPKDDSIWIEIDKSHWPLDFVRVWDTYPDIGASSNDLTPDVASFYRGVVAFEIIAGRNGPKEGEGAPNRCRRIWPLSSFLRDFEPALAPYDVKFVPR